MGPGEPGQRGLGLDRLGDANHHVLKWVQVLSLIAAAVSILGFVLGLGRVQHADEAPPLMLVWAAIAWAGTVTIIATEVF